MHSAMPKQDKGGGIIPTAEGARVVLISRGRQNAATLLAIFYFLLAFKTRETRVKFVNPLFILFMMKFSLLYRKGVAEKLFDKNSKPQ